MNTNGQSSPASGREQGTIVFVDSADLPGLRRSTKWAKFPHNRKPGAAKRKDTSRWQKKRRTARSDLRHIPASWSGNPRTTPRVKPMDEPKPGKCPPSPPRHESYGVGSTIADLLGVDYGAYR